MGTTDTKQTETADKPRFSPPYASSQESCGKGLPACQPASASLQKMRSACLSKCKRIQLGTPKRCLRRILCGPSLARLPGMGQKSQSRVVGTFWLAGEPFSCHPRVSGQRKRQDGNGQLCDLMATSPEFATYTRESFHMCCLIFRLVNCKSDGDFVVVYPGVGVCE